MKKVPLKQLKENLSAWAERAHLGEPIEVTRYNRPYMRLVPPSEEGEHVGPKAGSLELKPAFRRPVGKGRFLAVLMDDRDED